jgi:hypothetical protein
MIKVYKTEYLLMSEELSLFARHVSIPSYPVAKALNKPAVLIQELAKKIKQATKPGSKSPSLMELTTMNATITNAKLFAKQHVEQMT